MKKFFTLLFCSILLSAATFAQSDHRGWNNNTNYSNQNRDRNYGYEQSNRYSASNAYKNERVYQLNQDRDAHHEGFGLLRGIISQVIRPVINISFTYHNYSYGISQRDAVIGQISAYYDDQIQQVLNDCTLNSWEKRDAVNNLQARKAREINNIYAQCGDAQYPG